jgi:hypothetical protein
MRKASRGASASLRDAAADAHHHLDRGRRNLGNCRHGGPNPTLMLDTLLALIMVIMNGMVGVTLLIGGVKHREQTFNLRGAST